MDGRSSTLLLALVLAGSAMTGCIQNPDWLNRAADTEASAHQNLALANDAALAWSPEAVLVGVMAFELHESPDPRMDADPDPGNGLAPAWWYVYCATEPATAASAEDAPRGDGEAAGGSEDPVVMKTMVRAFKVTADGTVTSEEDAEAMAAGMDHEMAEELGEWTVDSDDALAAAKTDAQFAKVAQGFNATVVEGVAHHEGKTAWWVSAMSVDGFVVATVDAVTGALLEVEAIDMDFEMPAFEWGAANPSLAGEPVWLEGEGVARAGDAPLEIPFATTSPVHGVITIAFAMDMPTDGLHWAILDDEGERVAGDHLGGWSGMEGSYEAEVILEHAGEYTLSLFYMDSFGFLPGPSVAVVGGEVAYSFVLDLIPGEAGHDEDEEG